MRRSSSVTNGKRDSSFSDINSNSSRNIKNIDKTLINEQKKYNILKQEKQKMKNKLA